MKVSVHTQQSTMAALSQSPLSSCFHGSNVYSSNSSPGIFCTNFSYSRISRHFKSPSTIRSPCPQNLRLSAVLETMDRTVTVHGTALVTPVKVTERKSVFLSNIDKNLNFKAGTILFFAMNPNFPFEKVVAKLKNAYRKMLVHYDFLAGRLRWNSEDDRLEIDCNAAGAGFTVASCDMSYEELRARKFPNTVNQQFAPRKWNAMPEDQPLFVLQVTSLRCGGFAIGFSLNHVTIDGISSKIFLENLASVLAGNGLVLPPYSNRQLLSARSPPRVTFPHPELFNFENINRNTSDAMPLKATFQKLNSKYFQLSYTDIMNLKQKARMDCVSAATGFNVVAAHIWKCVAQAKNPENDPEKLSTVLYAVNIRSRLQPRLPSSYAGNAIVSAYARATCGEIRKMPFSHLVEMISQGDKRVSDEYVKSIIDWCELYKGFPYGDALISSWWNLGLNEIEYPWGKPRWSCPVVPNHGNNAITLMPEVEGKKFKGLQVLVSLQHKHMETFESLFREL